MAGRRTALFSKDQYKHLIEVACGPSEGATTQQIEMFIAECEKMKRQAIILDVIMSGKVKVTQYTDDDFVFSMKST